MRLGSDTQMRLVIAEKPDMAKAFSEAMKVTGKFTKGDGYYKNSEYVITWAFGHLVNSKQPEDYPNEFGGWNWESIPFVPPPGKLEYHLPIKIDFDNVRKKQLQNIKKICKEFSFDEIINGCDAGREGDLIFWEVYEILKMKQPVKRLWVQSQVEVDIQKAFKNLRGEEFFGPRKEAAFSRQFADWILGHNLTIAFTVKSGRILHVGRVQTPTLSLLVKRRLEIENFQTKDFYEIKANFGGKYDGMWFKDAKGNTKFEEKSEADAITQKINGQEGTVVSKVVETKPVYPKELFDLGSLSTEANKKFGFSMQKTLDVAQVLYDKYKVLSYPRTDSNYIMSSQIPELPTLLNAVDTPEYSEFVKNIIERKIPTSKRFVNDKKVTDHHAIIPTKKVINWNEVTDEVKQGTLIATKDDIKKLYDLVVRRFLSVFYPEAIYEKTEIVTEVVGETFKTNGRILKDPGWEVVYGKEVNESEEENENDEKTLPPIEKDEVNLVSKVEAMAKQTKPKPQYTEGTIGTAMENAKDYVEEDELKAEMKEAGAGLGTVATRAQILENLIKRNYVVRKGKQIIASDLAVKLIEIAPERLKSPEVTAQWEKELRLMEEEKVQREDFYERIVQYVTEEIAELKNKTINIVFEREGQTVVGTCPKCGKDIVEFSKGFACQSSNKEHTCLRVWKGILDKKVTTNQFKRALTKGETNTIKFKNTKTGKTFEAKLKLNDQFDGFDFVFPARKTVEKTETSALCPSCGGKIVEMEKLYGCSNFSSKNCKFTVWKNIGGKPMTLELIQEVIEKKKTEKLEGFVSKGSGKPYKAKLVWNPEKKTIEMSFE